MADVRRLRNSSARKIRPAPSHTSLVKIERRIASTLTRKTRTMMIEEMTCCERTLTYFGGASGSCSGRWKIPRPTACSPPKQYCTLSLISDRGSADIPLTACARALRDRRPSGSVKPNAKPLGRGAPRPHLSRIAQPQLGCTLPVSQQPGRQGGRPRERELTRVAQQQQQQQQQQLEQLEQRQYECPTAYKPQGYQLDYE